ncbi:hypothetical protein [Ostreibacterium oceani]|uniref:Uncharacterized protein n=1 Tax=Ostreibacterium oceani TaxID=2654998 RepID=A0A6N7EVW3_9GAMM|nr:hypothetical protein [Ostreibacterium oceani]MPV86904.1 hypothetical protein [Ostreibacterium oceani]
MIYRFIRFVFLMVFSLSFLVTGTWPLAVLFAVFALLIEMEPCWRLTQIARLVVIITVGAFFLHIGGLIALAGGLICAGLIADAIINIVAPSNPTLNPH